MKKSAQKHSNRNTKTLLLFSLLIANCSLLIVSCVDMFQEKIPNPNKNDSLDSLFRKEEEITKLQRPQQFFVAPYYSSTEIRLTWTGVRGAAYYMVERATASLEDWQKPGYQPDDGDYEAIDRFVYGTSFTDVILKSPALDAPENQNRYYYRVSAFNTAKKYDESDPTEPVSAMLFNAPDNVRASGGKEVDCVELQWDRSAGAESYEIWRSDFASGVSASSLGVVTGNQTWFRNMVSVDEQGKDFYYMVSAKNGFGNKSPMTRPAYGYARVAGAPNAPVVRLADNSGRGQSKSEIKIEWDPADEPDVYYAVYRYSSLDSSLTRLTDKTDKPEWPDTVGLKPGVFYYYKVQAIVDDIASGKSLKSQFSSSDPEGFIISPPDTVVAEKKSDGSTVIVKWKPAIGKEVERLSYKYKVYADKKSDVDFTTSVGSLIDHDVDGEGFISVDGLSVTDGAFFRVSTVNSLNVESAQSIVVSPAPAAAIIQAATQRAYFQGAAANSNGVYPVKITWKKPADEEPAFYHVQRSTRSGAGFSTINEAPLEAKDPLWSEVFSYDHASGVYTYIDKNETAKVGRKFYYRVLSLNELKQGNFPSSEAIGWGALTHEQYILEYNKTMGSALKKLTYMYKSGTSALGTETKNGAIRGTIYYDASLSGLTAKITILLTNYVEFYIENEREKGEYFILNGNSNTSANTSSNGSMNGTVTCTGMYPGKVSYDRIEIRGGAAGGGTYGVEPEGGGRKEIGYTILN